jgi:3-carboxy-cis,cis-muconate cycloisomerase
MTDLPLAGSALLAPIFASGPVRAAFSDRAILQAMLDFEAALAEAEAEAGIIPTEAAGPIRAACQADSFDIAAIGREAALAGNVAIPLVKALTAHVPKPARGFVHWAATSQDAIDTAFMLCARHALQIMRGDLKETMAAAARLAERNRGTLMSGRTLLQQALPISFGFKAAGWLSGLTAAAERLRRAEGGTLALQFGGAAGTLAAIGADGVAVRRRLAERLRLAEAPVTWHAERGRIADLAHALATLSGACAKPATDIALMMQSEIAEAFEPGAPGKGGSSTMPHKRNPVGATAIRANHRRIAGLVATVVMGLEGEHERSAGSWAAEWETLGELFCLAAGSLERLRDMLDGLEIDAARMRANLDAGLGLPLAESLTMALAPAIGRAEAHHRVEAASKLALAARRPLAETATAEPSIAGHLSTEAIDRALDPVHYLGSTEAMIDAALAAARLEMERL